MLSVAGLLHGQTSDPVVRFHTTQGDIDVTLTRSVTPLTVANFLNYVNKGAYTNSIFHRSVPGFIIQGGGFQLQNHAPVATPQDPAVRNEYKISNTRGTIAMAKLGTDPNSATNQWFFNLANNAANLNNQNGGFTVFGNVSASTLAIMDKIAAVPVYNAGSPFDALPLTNYKTNTTVQDSNFVLVTSIELLAPPPTVSSAGFQSAASFASSSAGIAPGEFLVIYGQALGPADLTTLALDGTGAVSTSLAGTRVLFDGTPGAMIYTSAGQVSVIAPYNLAGKTSVSIQVEYQGTQTAALQFPVLPANPAIFTPGKPGQGDAAIIRTDYSLVNAASPAAPGDVLSLFGEGYGAVVGPGLPDGAVVGSALPVPATSVVLLIDGQTVPTQYAGGAPSLVNGVLQVNFAVPAGLAPGSHQVQIQVGSAKSPNGVTLQTR